MRKLKIGEISPLNLPIPPEKYGGTEMIIDSLCKGFTKKGHKVTLFAADDSNVDCDVCSVTEKSLWNKDHKDSSPYYACEMATVAQKANELNLDVLHDHLGPWSLALYGQVNVPVIHTLHVPFEDKDRIWGYKKFNSKLISISNAQREPAPNLNYAATIYNGIDINNFSFNDKPKNHFVWVGELSPRKGILEVIQIAKKTNIKLNIIGRIPPPVQRKDHKFFKKHIEKELNKGKIRYVGKVKKSAIGKYYRTAKAFLYPLQWREPFGLTMVESMACGTPVIAFDRGSVSELVKDNETGFVVPPKKNGKKNIKGFIKAIEKIDQIRRKDCRKWVKEKFTTERMVNEYEKVFYDIIN